MTSVDMTLYWPAAEDWTGFLQVIVPVGRLPVSGEELRRLVREQIETDAVLYDLVTVALAPHYQPTPGWDRRFLASVVEAAMPDRHCFAPRGAIAIVVVAREKQKVCDVLDDLKNLAALNRLHAQLFGVVVRTAERGGMSQDSVLKIAKTATRFIEMCDEEPRIALAERTFLGRVNDLIAKYRMVLPGLEPQPPAGQLTEQTIHVVRLALESSVTEAPVPEAPAIEPAPSRPRLSAPPAVEPRELESVPAAESRRPEPVPIVPVQKPPAAALDTRDPAPSVRSAPAPQAALPAAQPMRRRVEAVLYDGAEIVTVEQRTPMHRLTGQRTTDADALDELGRDGRAVGLVHLVFVPDDGVVGRPLAKRRNTIALELDQALASVDLDVSTGLPVHVAVEVFCATNPVQKHGVLRSAGDLAESALPKVEIEYFSLPETVEPLLDAARRTSRALRARGVEVVSLHLLFLAAMRFPADESTAEDWIRLLDHARVTWVDFSPPDRRQPLYPMPASPFGLHVLTDKEDVVAVIKQQSEVLYRYASTPGTGPAASDQFVDDPPVKARRWWSFGKQPAE